jgi:hypothetical protein
MTSGLGMMGGIRTELQAMFLKPKIVRIFSEKGELG